MSSSWLFTVSDTVTVQLYQMGSALGGGGGGFRFFIFLGAVGSRFSHRPNPMYLQLIVILLTPSVLSSSPVFALHQAGVCLYEPAPVPPRPRTRLPGHIVRIITTLADSSID